MKTTLRLLAWLVGLLPLSLPTTVLAEGSKQLTPNRNPGVALTDPTNTRSGFLEHDANFTGANVSNTSRAFLKPTDFTRNGSAYSDNQRMYVLVKPGETVYYGVHRVAHTQGGTSNQGNLVIVARWSADGTGQGTIGRISKILRDSSAANSTAALRQSAFLVPQTGVIVDTVQNRVGPKVGGLPANGYTPLSYSNTTSSTQYVWFEFVQQGESTSAPGVLPYVTNTAFTDGQRFSVYDFWDFTVKETATGATKLGRLFSKQWAFSAGQADGRFSAAFNMYPLIPSPVNVGRFFVKKFELAGLAPQNFFRFVSNSMGSTASTTDFTVSRKSQTTQIDYPEYLNFVNDPDPAIWPSADNPDLKVVSTASYCKGTGGVLEFFLNSALGGQVNILIDLNGVPGFQAGTRDVLIAQTIPVGNSRVEWNGRDGLNVVVSSGTVITLTFQNSVSPIAPVNFPVWDAEDNQDGFRVQNVRPGRAGFDVLYWDDSNLSTTTFPETSATPRVQAVGLPSITGVHTWGGAAGTPTVNAGDLILVNTYTFGNTEQQVLNFTFSYVCDPDGDGVNDNLDIDQDNDGITNTAESGGIDPTFITANNVPRYLDAFEPNFVDINSDGINDIYDLDLDGRPNFLDIDADGDGIPDTIEANGGIAPTGYQASIGRFPSTAVGLNGMPDVAETVAENGITTLPLTNTDNVGRPDYLDIDSDDDGIVDNIEAQATAAYRAPLGADADGDGLDNRYDPTPGTGVTAGVAVPLTNTDGTDLPDYRDLNSDNDSRVDAVEGWDTNNDGVAEIVASGVDADGDGLDDAFDRDNTRTNPTNGQTPLSFPNLSNTTTAERDWREVFTPANISTTINGRVFEDVNYGGGAGRDYATANNSAVASGFATGTILRSGVTVELYDASGVFVATTTTVNGTYTFTLINRAPGNYSVRVVSSSGFTSVRSPATTGLLPVQTFANGATDRVGGEVPGKTDGLVRSGAQTLTDIVNGGATTAQSITTITVPSTATATTPVSNIDFGFNFDVVVNTNDAGQGSLRQFILNSNALPNTSLNQAAFNGTVAGGTTGTDPAAGVETSIFMIGDGRTSNVPNGLRAGVSGGFSGSAATITLTTALPNITDANTALDGSKQTSLTGNTLAAATETTTGPEVVINFNGQKGLFVTGASTRVASIGLSNARGTVTTTGSPTFSDGAGVTINGTAATGSVVTDVTAINNAIAGIRLDGGTTGVTVSNNVVSSNVATTNGGTTYDADGINLVNASSNTITGNVMNNNRGWGLLLATSGNNGNTVSSNIIRNNGGGTSTDDAGIGVLFGNNNLFSQNIITGNTGDGIVALSGTSGNLFTKNSTSGNGNLGIDLSATTAATGDDVSLNANGKTATNGANGLLNFPVLTQAVITAANGNLQITGFAPVGSVVEFFLSDKTTDGFGQGKTYLFSTMEGASMTAAANGTSAAIADADARFGNYSGIINGVNQGLETGATRFSYSIPLSTLTPAQVTALTSNTARLTATATTAGTTTSEFSGNILIKQNSPLPVELKAFEVATAKTNALLTWSTASEKNNDHFDVERSLDGRSFERIGQVRGQGTTAQVTNYSFTDANVGSKHPGVVYYRLQQVDADGTASFSPVRTVRFSAQAAGEVQIGVFPNPATVQDRTVTLDLSALPQGSYQATLLDATGRSMGAYQVQGGVNKTLDMQALPAGVYIILVRGNGFSLNQRLMKK